MKIKTTYKFGYISKEGYRHFPILYFGNGIDGFCVCVIGLTFTVKL